MYNDLYQSILYMLMEFPKSCVKRFQFSKSDTFAFNIYYYFHEMDMSI